MSWIETLKAQGIEIDEAGICQADDASPAEVTVTPLTHLGLFDVIGPDAEKFLQGQLSCDMADISAGQSLLGSHNNIKGSMVSLCRLMVAEGGFWLRTERSILSQAQANLKKYMIFSKAESTDLSEQVAGFGISGSKAAEILQSLGFDAPAEINTSKAIEAGTLIKVPGERFELWLKTEQAEQLLPKLLEQATLTGTNSWQLAEIRSGIPELFPQTLETFIPQMTNLQVFGGVSFSKGCYTGQEIITRLQHRGKLSRPMYRLGFKGEAPQPGTAVSTPDRSAGTVVNAAYSGEGKGELLAVMLKDSFDDAAIELTVEGNDQPLDRLDLPYELDPELFERAQRL